MEAYHGQLKKNPGKSQTVSANQKTDLEKLKIASSYFVSDNGRYTLGESSGTKCFLTQLTAYVIKYKQDPIQNGNIR